MYALSYRDWLRGRDMTREAAGEACRLYVQTETGLDPVEYFRMVNDQDFRRWATDNIHRTDIQDMLVSPKGMYTLWIRYHTSEDGPSGGSCLVVFAISTALTIMFVTWLLGL